jgi:hypothetical protein
MAEVCPLSKLQARWNTMIRIRDGGRIDENLWFIKM